MPLFADVSFELRGNSKTCLCGPNGCGKTTLLNLLRGHHKAMSGQVQVAGKITSAHLGQHVEFADENKTVLEELLSRAEISEGAARDMLARYGFRDTHVFKQLSVLSGGERSRLYLACLLLEQPAILFLDEPTNHLDTYSREILEQALIAYDGAILAVSHDRMFIEHCCSRVLGFISTRVEEFGTYEAYRNTARSSELKQDPESENKNPGKNRPAENRRRNRAHERRETALQKEKLRTIELSIEELEQEKEQIEAKFGADTDPDEYHRYADVLDEIDKLYAKFLEIEASLNSDP